MPDDAPAATLGDAKTQARGMLAWFLKRYGVTEETVDQMILAFEATLRYVRKSADDLLAGQRDVAARVAALEELLPPKIPIADGAVEPAKLAPPSLPSPAPRGPSKVQKHGRKNVE